MPGIQHHKYLYMQSEISWFLEIKETLRSNDEIVSSDVIGTTFGGIFDPTQTEVVTTDDYQLIKTVSWYDNEYGFVCQMVRVLNKLAKI